MAERPLTPTLTDGWVKLAARQARESAVARDNLIRKAYTEGASIRLIAEQAGLSSARIHQIIHRQ